MILYHGSNEKLEPGEFLLIEKSKSTVLVDEKYVPAIFASTDIFYSIAYALDEFGGMFGNNKYASVLTRPNAATQIIFGNILSVGYLYEVDEKTFVHKAVDGVASIEDVRILKRHEMTAEFLKSHGYIVKKNRFPKKLTKMILKRIERKETDSNFIGEPKKYDKLINMITKTLD